LKRNEEAGTPPDGDKVAQKRELDLLDRRIATARDAHRSTEAKGTRPAPTGKPSDMGVAMRLSSELVAGVLMGAGIGWFFDWLFGTLPIFLVIFTGLGTVAGVKNVLRATQAMNATAAEKKKDPSGH
jgi:ATP synthase protein I|tara:strand:+ start:10364 stop:10744 length:381 start_codon:yes stop_codon:yes gene_type:complete